jgi:membrane dipeptidase
MFNCSQRAASAAAALLLAAGVAAADRPDAAAIHQRVITFDAQMDIPADFMLGEKDVGSDTPMQVDLPKMDAGGLDGAAFVVFVGQGERSAAGYAGARAAANSKLAAIETMLAAYPGRIGLARTAREAEALVAAGRHFAMISIVNAYPFGEDLGWLQDWHARGLRMVAFTHAGHNQYADSNRPQARFGDTAAEHGGLSSLGRAAIREMNRLGIIVDVSQITPAAVKQAVELSRTPVVASHVGVRTIVDNPRNLTDESMQAIAARGGVVCIVAFNAYLRAPSAEQLADLAAIEKRFGLETFTQARRKLSGEQLAEFGQAIAAWRARWPGATVSDLVDSIDYAVKLIGIDHVGVSTDMEHSGGVVGYQTAAEAGALTAELVRRGYSETEIGKLWSGNVFRVWRAVASAAEQ